MLINLAKAQEELPVSLANRPILTAWQQTFMDAFYTLSSSRTYTSASASTIPYPFILQWLDEHLITDLSDREEAVYLIQSIDNAYLQSIIKPTG